MSAPPQPTWPSGASDLYEPVRPLGTGGFGSVWMARRKGDAVLPEDEVEVAIKLVGRGNGTSATRSEAGYARREAEILSELSHPHIMRLLRAFGNDDDDDDDGNGNADGNGGEEEGIERPLPFSIPKTPTCLVLSLARGPTLETLLRDGGALGVHVARVVVRQLVDAVGYLHGHAVLHRDIKPDNVIVSGVRGIGDDAVWSDGPDGEKEAASGRFVVTLIDFGFARALSPSEVNADIGLYKAVQEAKEAEEGGGEDGGCYLNGTAADLDEAMLEEGAAKSSRDKKKDKKKGGDIDKSVSKSLVLDLSALGNRSYAAPEILNGVRKSSSKPSGRSASLSECVSDYGMVADAFSLGATVRYTLTGVPPSFAVDEFMAMQNHPLAKASKMAGKLAKKLMKKKKGATDGEAPKKRKKRYKYNDQLPKEAANLVQALTHWDHNKRATVRSVQSHPWIAEDGEGDGSGAPMTRRKVQFLQCAMEEVVSQEE